MDTMSWLQTRGASTLLVVTFLASASLLLLTVHIDKQGDVHDNDALERIDVGTLGFSFALIGLSYRQITVWTIDRMQYNREVDLARMYIRSTTTGENLRDLRDAIRSVIQGNDIRLSIPAFDLYIRHIRCDPELANKVEILHNRMRKTIFFVQAFFRELLVVFFLLIPVELWRVQGCQILIICESTLPSIIPNIDLGLTVLLDSAILAIIISFIDLGLRARDRCAHPTCLGEAVQQ